ncbi:MAG: TonB family protein, partial [SAR324 cluster bacterium]|nr:TonB family protein [SAR324 cluster bacterium]
QPVIKTDPFSGSMPPPVAERNSSFSHQSPVPSLTSPMVSPLQTGNDQQRPVTDVSAVSGFNPHSPEIDAGSDMEGNNPRSILKQIRIEQIERQYQQQLSDSIKAKLYAPQRFDKKIFVRLTFEIDKTGDILNFRILESSGSETFDITVKNAVKSAQFPPLPAELAEVSPYAVIIRISP